MRPQDLWTNYFIKSTQRHLLSAIENNRFEPLFTNFKGFFCILLENIWVEWNNWILNCILKSYVHFKFKSYAPYFLAKMNPFHCSSALVKGFINEESWLIPPNKYISLNWQYFQFGKNARETDRTFFLVVF